MILLLLVNNTIDYLIYLMLKLVCKIRRVTYMLNNCLYNSTNVCVDAYQTQYIYIRNKINNKSKKSTEVLV